jgi:hypothetical protein
LEVAAMSPRLRSFALIAAAAGIAASLVPGSTAAQVPDSSRRSGFRPRVAAGVDAMLYDGPQRVPSVYGVAGLEWLHPRAPFSARFDLSYFRRDRDFGERNCDSFCIYDQRDAVVGASIDGRYTFLSRASVRPYLVSGFGLYHSSWASTANVSCADLSCVPVPEGRATFRERSLGLGMHGGFGFAFPIRRSELTLEFIIRQRVSGTRYGYTMPVTLGIRF